MNDDEIAEARAEHEEWFGAEELDPELAAHLTIGAATGMTMIHHPLVVSAPHVDALNKQMNRALRMKRAALIRARAECDWHTFVFLHERPYRRDALKVIASELDDAEYWTLLGSIWSDTENLFQWGDDDLHDLLYGVDPEEDANGEWCGVLGDRDASPRDHWMDDVDRRALAVLDDEILIYRGYTADGTRLGWSWTTDHLIALWFARRYTYGDVGQQRLVCAKVRKDDVFVYDQGRGESEVVADPARVYDVADVELSATCECGLPMPVVERISHEQHMANHAGAHTNHEVG